MSYPWEMGAYNVLAGKFEWKRQLEKPRSGRIINIKMHIKEISQKDVDAIHQTQVMDKWCAVVNTVLNPVVPKYADSFLISFSTKFQIRGIS